MITRLGCSTVHHGAALLIVLAVLIITMTAATILVSRAADQRVQRKLASCQLVADDLLQAANMPIQHWLENKASKVVLPPDVNLPACKVLHDRWRLSADDEAVDVELAVTAFDQYGMVPLQMARSGSPLRLTLPQEVLQCIDRVTLPPQSDPTPFGLDLVALASRDGRSSALKIFAPSTNGAVRVFGGMEGEAVEQPQASLNSEDESTVGGLVATHNRGPIRINVNTAPMALVEAAMRLAGRGGIDLIREARTKGVPATIGGAVADAHPEASNAAAMPEIVTSSDRWAFRIDVQVGPLKRSWWAIYGPGPDLARTRRQESWMCLQRLPITE